MDIFRKTVLKFTLSAGQWPNPHSFWRISYPAAAPIASNIAYRSGGAVAPLADGGRDGEIGDAGT
jgi:hypothetical protein